LPAAYSCRARSRSIEDDDDSFLSEVIRITALQCKQELKGG